MENIYVHIDSTSNAVTSRGITHTDFSDNIVHYPHNLLLLDPHDPNGQYEKRTGLKVIEGKEAVELYFNELRRKRSGRETKWLDFTDPGMLAELTPLELSEILYLGHTKTQLHSPFFYKLQNNFVYFENARTFMRIYYRYLDEFYRIMAIKVAQIVEDKLNERKSFFRRPRKVAPIDNRIMREMEIVLTEGAVLAFREYEEKDRQAVIPLYIVEDRWWKSMQSYQKPPKVGELAYNYASQTWYFALDENGMEQWSAPIEQ
ncbi:hypothetical protein QUW13_01350 [Enterococcus hirae]|nr:hypothetical protein [Enterococcus hirae]